MSIEVDITGMTEELYGSKHYLFRVLEHNGLELPTEFGGGDVIEFPPRAANARPGEAAARRQRATYQPV